MLYCYYKGLPGDDIVVLSGEYKLSKLQIYVKIAIWYDTTFIDIEWLNIYNYATFDTKLVDVEN